jgi:hypothetical protein
VTASAARGLTPRRRGNEIHSTTTNASGTSNSRGFTRGAAHGVITTVAGREERVGALRAGHGGRRPGARGRRPRRAGPDPAPRPRDPRPPARRCVSTSTTPATPTSGCRLSLYGVTRAASRSSASRSTTATRRAREIRARERAARRARRAGPAGPEAPATTEGNDQGQGPRARGRPQRGPGTAPAPGRDNGPLPPNRRTPARQAAAVGRLPAVTDGIPGESSATAHDRRQSPTGAKPGASG